MKFKNQEVTKFNKINKHKKADKLINKNKLSIKQKQQHVQDDYDALENGQQQIDWKQQNQQSDQQYNEQDQINGQQTQQQEEPIGEQNNINEQQDHVLVENERNLQDYQQQVGNKGVVYMSRIPPYMTPSFIRKLLKLYDVERIYLLPESQWARNNRIKKGGSKRICFREGWIEFTDKKEAKMAALTLNGQKMVQKKGTFYSQDVWNLKYLPKFKWHHLTQKLAHEERLKKQRLRLQMEQQRKLQQYYTTQVHKSKTIKGIVKSKENKGKFVNKQKIRSFGQTKTIQQEQD